MTDKGNDTSWLLTEPTRLLASGMCSRTDQNASRCAPDWAIKSVIVLLLIGLPVALIFSWVYEMTPDGLKLEKDVVREESITPQTGRRIDRVVIGALVLALRPRAKRRAGSWGRVPVSTERGEGVVLLVEDEAPVRAFAARALT